MDKRNSNVPEPHLDAGQTPVQDRNAETSPDDLRVLLDRANLDQSSYREFPSAIHLRRTSPGSSDSKYTEPKNTAEGNRAGSPQRSAKAVAVTQREEDQEPAVNLRQDQRPRGPEAATPAEPDRCNNSYSSPEFTRRNALPHQRTPWAALDNLFSGSDQQFRFIEHVAKTIDSPLLFLRSLRGGAGATTIAATLARCLAGWGERTTVVETQADSVLPVFFGGRENGGAGVQGFDVPGSQKGILVIKGPVERRRRSTWPDSQDHTEGNSLYKRLREASTVSDRLLLDVTSFSTKELIGSNLYSRPILAPIVPDFSCVSQIVELQSYLDDRSSDNHFPVLLYYVLNKFDSSVALHRDIQNLLADQLGDRLLPITIRRTDAIAEALAKGMTVVDYCPETGVAEDFLQLAEWVRSTAIPNEKETHVRL